MWACESVSGVGVDCVVLCPCTCVEVGRVVDGHPLVL